MKKGFTLIEMVVYVAILSVVFAIVVNTVLIVGGAWGRARVERNIETQGSAALERILREVRLAESVNTGGSVVGAHPGRLMLNTVASASDDTPTTREFYLDTSSVPGQASSTLMMAEDTAPGAALTANAAITRLVFYRIDNGGTSEAVRVELTAEDGVGRYFESKNFYGTAVLRRSY